MILSLKKLMDVCRAQCLCSEEMKLDSAVLSSEIKFLLFDSRKLNAPEQTVFFAIRTSNNDGHRYIGQLYDKGVRFFVCEQRPERLLNHAVYLLVDSSVRALQRLGKYARDAFGKPVVAITGSNGKTIVKEWMVQLIADDRKVCYSARSYNSQIGVAVSLWQLDSSFDFGIFEAGISMPGEMESLHEMIRPDLGIFTNIGLAHQANFSSMEEKIDEKLKLFLGCRKLICSRDNPFLFSRVERWCNSNGVELVSYSSAEVCRRLEAGFTDRVSMENAASAYVAAVEMGIDPEVLGQRVGSLTALEMRLERKEGLGGSVIINDSYCFDLTSLETALDYLNRQDKSLGRVAILSQMGENQDGRDKFGMISSLLQSKNVEKLHAIGGGFISNRDLFKPDTSFYDSVEDFIDRCSLGDFYSKAVLIKGARCFNMERISSLLEARSHQTVLEVNLSALADNVKYFRSLLQPRTFVMAMVKASSYGCGGFEVAQALEQNRLADYLTVAFTDEAVLLRNNGITLPIVVVTPEKEALEKMIEYGLEPVVHNFDTLSMVADSGLKIHIKLDTGMHRLGFEEREMDALTDFLKSRPDLHIASVFSHLACADAPEEDPFTMKQLERFESLSKRILSLRDYRILRHICNSAATARFPQAHYDMVRLGIGMYGIGYDSAIGKHLRYVHRLQSRLSEIRTIEKGESVSYMRRFTAERTTRIGVIPIGYADGLNRHLSERGFKVWLNGSMVPIVGSICMDMCMLDLGDLEARVGDRVVVFGEENPVENMAEALDTIPYEIFTSVSQRIKRVYYHES